MVLVSGSDITPHQGCHSDSKSRRLHERKGEQGHERLARRHGDVTQSGDEDEKDREGEHFQSPLAADGSAYPNQPTLVRPGEGDPGRGVFFSQAAA